MVAVLEIDPSVTFTVLEVSASAEVDPASDPHAVPLYPSKLLVVVFNLICPATPDVLCPVVPTGTPNAPVPTTLT